MSLSYRDHLMKIGIGRDETVSYRAFPSRPDSLKAAILSMKAPASESWAEVSNIYAAEDWTDEVQGVAWNGTHWMFATNSNQAKPGSEDKALYAFRGGTSLGDGDWEARIKFFTIPHPIASTEDDSHWGQLTYYKESIYVAHWWADGPKKNIASAVVFKSSGKELTFERWVELERPTVGGKPRRAEFQGINPWDDLIYSYYDGVFYMHYLHGSKAGKLTGGKLKLSLNVTKMQGACFSPNGHIYLASNSSGSKGKKYQSIWYFSALNGQRLGLIPVLAEEEYPDEELEGLCFAESITGGNQPAAQLHVVLLDNTLIELDNIYFKSFASTQANWV